jgi:hypothetical protein
MGGWAVAQNPILSTTIALDLLRGCVKTIIENALTYKLKQDVENKALC